jgi:predicted DNA-binding ArsR family transcriptional regulator
MNPSAQDIAAMKKLRQIVEDGDAKPHVQQREMLVGHRQQKQPLQTGRTDVDAMAEILHRFNNVSTGTATKLFEDSRNDSRLREALNTQEIDDGIRIGLYEVKVGLVESATGGVPQKAYHVVNSQTNEKLCDSLSMLEAAHAVVRYLNKGIPFSDSRIKHVMELEEAFTRNRMDAARFKYRYERCVALKEVQAGNVFADRFQVAKANALVALDQIRNILNSIR